MFFRKFVFISLICGVLASCGYEGQEECESHFKNQTYRYKEACNCLREKAKNNGVKNFKNFIMVISNENNREDLARMAIASAFGSKSIGTETETYLRTLTDAGSFCRLNDPDISLCIVCGKGYISSYNGVDLLLKSKQVSNLKREGIEKYLFKGDSFSDLTTLIATNVKHPAFYNHAEINEEKAKELDQKIPFEYRAWFFLFFNDEFGKVYNYFRNVEKYDIQDALDQAYASAFSVVNYLMNDKDYLNNYIKERQEVYSKDDDYHSILTKKYADIVNDLIYKIKSEKENK